MAVIFAIEFIGVLRILNNFAGDSIKKCVDETISFTLNARENEYHKAVLPPIPSWTVMR